MAEDGVVLGGSDAIAPRRWRQEARRRHSQRAEDPRLDPAVERLPGHALDHLHQDDGAQIGVAVAGAGRGEQRRRVDRRERGPPRRGLGIQGQIRREAGRMREQMPHGHTILHRPAKLRDVSRDRRVERQPALIYEDHAGGGQRDDLRERREIVQRARVDGTPVVDAVVPDGRERREPAVPSHGEHRSGKCAAIALGREVAHDCGQPGAVEAQRPRRCQGDPGTFGRGRAAR